MAATQGSSALRGVFREVRLVLGDIFGGGKLDENRELTIQVLFGLLGALARADGVVSAEEAGFANELMEELELPTRARALANEAFDRGRRQQLNLEQELERYIAQFPYGSPQVDHLYESLLRLAAADARIRPGERVFLDRVTRGLGYPAEALDTRLSKILAKMAPRTS